MAVFGIAAWIGSGGRYSGWSGALKDFPMIANQKFNGNFQRLGDERGVMPLLVRDQTVEDFSVSAQAGAAAIAGEDALGAGRHGRRIESAAHQHSGAFPRRRSATAASSNSRKRSTYSASRA